MSPSGGRWIDGSRWARWKKTSGGWGKGQLRKYDRQGEQRVIDIRKELRAAASYFFGSEVIQANYKNLYPDLEPPSMYFDTKTLREAGLRMSGNKKGKSRSRYISYPKRALDKLGEERPALDCERFVTRRRRLEEKLDALVSEGRRFSDPDNLRLAKRQHLFTFLAMEEVEATNNRAERALRPAVVARKTGGCDWTAQGARTHAVPASLLVTAKQQGQDPLDYLVKVLTAKGKLPFLTIATAVAPGS